MSDRDIKIRVVVKDDGTVALQTIGDTGQQSFRRVDESSKKAQASVSLLNRNVLDLAKGFAIAEIGLDAARAALRLLKDELVAGFDAVEDYNLSVASMSGFMTTFSEKAALGDLAGAFQEANAYAKELIPALEIMDAKTIATGKDLKVVAETMMMHGTIMDINNQKQVDGLLNIVNVTKMITAGQNQDIQFRQEINALMEGNLRMQDRLPRLLQKAYEANELYTEPFKDQLRMWQEQGTLIENAGQLLGGFGASTSLIEQTWTAIGSTMETIHTRILRGGMEPVYQDILDLAAGTNRELMSQDGQLTDLAENLQTGVRAGWLDIKNTVETVGNLVSGFGPLLELTGGLVLIIADGWGYVLAGLQVLSGHVRDFMLAMQESAKAILLWSKSIYDFTTLDFASSIANMEAGTVAFAESGRLMGKSFNINFFSELEAAWLEYQNGKKPAPSPGKAGAPKTNNQSTAGDSDDPLVALGLLPSKAEKAIDGILNEIFADIDKQSAALSAKRRQLLDQEAKSAAAAGKALEELYGQEGRAAAEAEKALLNVTRAALPEHERAVHDVHQAYSDLSAQVEQLYIIGEISKEVADQLHANLAVRMGEDLEALAEKGNKTFGEDLKTAITGWGAGFSAELNDLVWQADASFGEVALSFGKMLTQMMIQQSVVNPILGAFTGGSLFSSVAGFFGGGRASGGAVSPGTMYEVNEEGIPELLNVGNRTFLMMGSQGGHVTPPLAAAPGGGRASGGNQFVFQNTFAITPANAGASKDGNGSAQQMSQEIGRMLENQMRAFVVKEHHPGGLFDQLRKS